MKKKIITAISLILCFGINAHAFSLSEWAENSFNNMSSYGILTADIVSRNMQENITRAEFCQMLMNMYKCDKRIVLSDEDMNVFDDTYDTSVLEAYKAGIVSGKGDRIFSPDSPITRQEMAVMLSRTLSVISPDYNKYEEQTKNYHSQFIDSQQTSDWALSDMAAICSYKIITGNDLGETRPLDNASREQAICMLDRVYENFIQNTTIHTTPKFKTIDKKAIFEGKISASWQAAYGVNEYIIMILADDTKTHLITLPQNTKSIDETIEEIKGFNKYTIILGITKSNGTQVFSKPIKIDNKVKEQPTQESVSENKPQLIKPDVDSSLEPSDEEIQTPSYDNELIHSTSSSALSQKELRIFPDGVYFQTKEIAQENMVEVEIPAWRLNSNGTKTSYTAYVEVNKALAEDVINIFTEIYNDESQFPIKNIGGFSWRNTSGGRVSHHSYGTCIDINYDENYYVEPDGTPITGTLWLPAENPYSIAGDSIVVRTFAKYGWLWGGTAWSDKYAKDYMHFTYLGK